MSALAARLSSWWIGGDRADEPVRVTRIDQPLVWVTIALLAFGLVMVYSASVALPDNPRFARYSSTHFLMRQCLFVCVAMTASLLAFQAPVAFWERSAP